MISDPLTALPAHILGHITGERRRRLVEYLLRWDAPEAALVCLDTWLEAQPHLATLREARARVLLEQGRGGPALDLLDELDAERGMSESRRALRARVLGTLGRWDEAHVLLSGRPDDATAWRLRGELFCSQGRFEAAAEAYARAADLFPDGSAPLRGLAELALARGEPERARDLILRRQARLPDLPLDTRDLVLLRDAAARMGDPEALAAREAELQERRAAEQAALYREIGFDPAEASAHADEEAAEQPSPAHPLTPSPAHAAEPDAPPEALAALRDYFGYETFRPGQAAIVERVLRGKSVLGVLPTGAGKSLTYQLPALLLPGATLVLSPLIALMKDQIDNLPAALAERATTIHSALDSGEVAARLRGVAEGRYRLIYVAPERLRQQPFVHALRRAGLARVVVDEAHCVSLWGISFRPDYLFIRKALAELGSPALLALTATATPDTEAEIKAHLAPPIREGREDSDISSRPSRDFADRKSTHPAPDPTIPEGHEGFQESDISSRPSRGFADEQMATIRTSIFRPNLRFEVRHVGNKREKVAAVVGLCRDIAGPIVVYVRSRDGCEEVAARLRDHGVAAEHYHAQVPDRHGVQDRFMRGTTRVLVATVAFGMGVDKADVRAIVHYNLPQSVEAYYQEAGRAGRDGRPARCVLLYAPADKGQLTAWLREEALSKDYLRRVYGWLRGQVRDGWGVVALDDLRRDLHEEDETRMRVALGLLERVELLVRHFDLPRAATLLLRDGMFGDAAFQSFVQAARLRPGQPLDVDLIDLARRAGYAPDDLERRLLRWHDQGWLRYEGSARDVLLELRPAAPDVANRLDALLAEYARRQDERVDAIAAYARGLGCRHRTIAAHFGERLAPCRSACDICAPQQQPGAEQPTSRAEAPRPAARAAQQTAGGMQAAILAAVGELPGRLNDKELVCLLLGHPGYPATASFGRLAGADFAATRRVVAALIADGRLAYRNRALVPANGLARPAVPEAIDAAILSCLTHLPFPLGRSGLARVLKGSAASPVGPERCPEFALLGHMTIAAIETAIEQLVERGYLVRKISGRLPLLALSDRAAP